MSEQQKITFTFGDSISSDESSCSDIIIVDKLTPTKENVVGSKSSKNLTEDSSDWRDKTETVAGRNLHALKNSILTDVTLEVGPDITPFKAHKLILALGSPVFEAMFYGPLAEKGDKVSIPDLMPDGFKALLRHLYGNFTYYSNEVEALNAWIAADKYCVLKLKKDCESFFCNSRMSSSNVWKLFESAMFLNLISLALRCKQYLESHTESSLLDEGFLEAKMETVGEILRMSYTNVSELVLLKSVIHWGRHKVNQEGTLSLTEVLKPLLPHIRFGALSPTEFCQFLDETDDLLEKSDALAILKHLTQPLSYALPEWCCQRNWQRVRDSSATYSRKESSRKESSNKVLSGSIRKKEKRKDKEYIRPRLELTRRS